MNALLKLYDELADSVKQHSQRVAVSAVIMAKYAMVDLQAEYDGLNAKELTEAVRVGCLYHDVGKIFFPSAVLIHNGADAEKNRLAMLRSHTKDGHKQIEKHGKACFGKDEQFMQVVADIVLCHHEQYDGRGEPHGLSGEDIPPAAGLCALANKLDSLFDTFVVKMGDEFEFIAELIESQSGRCYSPKLIEWFVSARDELAALYLEQYEDMRCLQRA